MLGGNGRCGLGALPDGGRFAAVLPEDGAKVQRQPERVRLAQLLAQSHGLTFYDASYLAVAEEKEVVLVTADGKLYRRLPAGLPVELLE